MTSEGSGQNGTKTSVLSEWLTSCALRIALTEMIPSSVNTWCEVTEKCLVFFIADVIIQSKNKQFDSISEVVWTLPNYLLLISRQFHVNNDDITIVMRPACKHVWSIHTIWNVHFCCNFMGFLTRRVMVMTYGDSAACVAYVRIWRGIQATVLD